MNRTSRRAALGASVAALTAGTAPAGAQHPDAALIGLCGAYVAAVAAFNEHADADDGETLPLAAAIEAAESAVDAHPPVTLRGVRALADVAHWLAHHDVPAGSEPNWHGSPADWAADTVLHLRRLVPAEGGRR